MKTIYLLFLPLLIQYTVSAQDIKGAMENWRNYSSGFPLPNKQLEAPEGWFGLDSLVIWGVQFMQFTNGGGGTPPSKQVFKSSDGRNGTQAAMIVSKEMDSLGIVPGVLSNARISIDVMAVMGGGDIMSAIGYSGGTSISNRVTGVEAWVRYVPAGDDTAMFYAAAVLAGQGAGGSDSIIGLGTTLINATNTYTATTVSVIYTDPTAVPDKLITGFSSSAGMSGADGSTLYIDDVRILGGSNHVAGISSHNQVVQCYPNPSNGIIHLRASTETVTWTAYDITGKQVHQVTFTGMATADCSLYPPGMYLYRVTDRNGTVLQTGNFTLL